MEICELHLKNFRGYRDEVFKFSDDLNLIVGINGAGKTTALDSLAILFSWLVKRTLNDRSNGKPIEKLDIRNNTRGASVSVKVKHLGQIFEWTIGKPVAGTGSKEYRSDYTGLSNLVKLFQADLDQQPELASLPLVAYYPVDRAIVDIPIRIRGKHQFNQLSAYDEALNSAANFRRFFEWFRAQQEESRSYTMGEVIAHLKAGGTFESLDELPFDAASRQLEAVCSAIYKFMPEFSNLTVLYRPLRMVIEKGNERLNLLQLSGGEKIMLALVGDLARRLSHANPKLANPLEGEAIVLIDEIDLHLHPKWQRNTISRLKEVFPNCQFIVSSHSPHIITHLKPENVTVVSMAQDGTAKLASVNSTYGHSAEQILVDVMGLETTRPREVQSLIDSIYELISEAKFEDAERELSILKTQLNRDPDIVRAEAIISRKKILGK